MFVGASSREKAVATSLLRAYELRTEVRPDLLLGGVAIPERHARRREEHLRLLSKQAAGCSFFVTQIVYDVNAAKDLVSDYHYACAARNVKPAPIVFTFSVCGSVKTLEFVQWLGVDVPRWIENDLRHADDTLRRVLRASRRYGRRADLVLQARRCSIWAQRRERLDPPGRDRCVRPPRNPPTSRATSLGHSLHLRQSYWVETLVFEEVVPWLREQGVMDEAVFNTIFVENPRRWLAGE